MGKEITVIYPEYEEEPTERIMAAKRGLRVEKIDFTSLEEDLKSLMTLFENVDKVSSTHEINEAKMSVGLGKDTEGKIHVGISATLLHLLRGEIAGEFGKIISENQLFEIVIRKKS